MRVLFLISGYEVPSSRFRIVQFLPYLREAGINCHVAPSRPPKYRGWPWLGNRASQLPRRAFRLCDLARVWLQRFDVVVLERELLSGTNSFRFEEWFRRASRSLVLDVDDGLFVTQRKKFAAISAMCDLVIAGNRLLKEEAERYNSQTVVVPTVVDTNRYQMKPQSIPPRRRPVIGWTGTAANLSQLQPIASSLRHLARQRNFQLRIVAERSDPLREIDLSGVDVHFTPWNQANEVAELQDMDIGLMPLSDAPWDRYKCGLKIIQYMAVGIPAVASPVGVNCQLIAQGENGFLAESSRDWESQLRLLIDDPGRRAELGCAGRRRVEADFSVKVAVPKLVDALRTAASRTKEHVSTT